MREEQVTKSILNWLLSKEWDIVCFDFPQSGTGRFLHPNEGSGNKNKASINPDIVAVKNDICIFMENKDRYYHQDYIKINDLIVHDDYSLAINALLSGYKVSNIYYGIGLPKEKHDSRSVSDSHLVDFIIGVAEDKSIEVLYRSCPDIF